MATQPISGRGLPTSRRTAPGVLVLPSGLATIDAAPELWRAFRAAPPDRRRDALENLLCDSESIRGVPTPHAQPDGTGGYCVRYVSPANGRLQSLNVPFQGWVAARRLLCEGRVREAVARVESHEPASETLDRFLDSTTQDDAPLHVEIFLEKRPVALTLEEPTRWREYLNASGEGRNRALVRLLTSAAKMDGISLPRALTVRGEHVTIAVTDPERPELPATPLVFTLEQWKQAETLVLQGDVAEAHRHLRSIHREALSLQYPDVFHSEARHFERSEAERVSVGTNTENASDEASVAMHRLSKLMDLGFDALAAMWLVAQRKDSGELERRLIETTHRKLLQEFGYPEFNDT